MEMTQVRRCSGQEEHLCSNNTMGYITEGSVKCYEHKDEGATDFPQQDQGGLRERILAYNCSYQQPPQRQYLRSPETQRSGVGGGKIRGAV